jgi:hypothetical protein
VLSEWDWDEVLDGRNELEVLIMKVEQVIAASTEDETQGTQEEAEGSTSPDLVDTDSISLESIGGISDVVEDLKVCTECLADLSPSLDNPAQDEVSQEKLGDNLKAEFVGVSTAALPFVLGVREKYPLMTEELVIRVGESVFRRWSKLRPGVPTNINPVNIGEKEDQEQNDSVFGESSLAPSKYGHHSQTTKSTYSAPSIFDEESEPEAETEKTILQVIRRRRPDSVTSVRTSIATGAPKSRARRRIPMLPDKVKAGAAFQCQYCREQLGDVRNQSQWK